MITNTKIFYILMERIFKLQFCFEQYGINNDILPYIHIYERIWII